MKNNSILRGGIGAVCVASLFLVQACTTTAVEQSPAPAKPKAAVDHSARPAEIKPKANFAPRTVVYTPITVKLVSPTPSALAAKKRTTQKKVARALSIPTGQNVSFDLSLDSWPAGVTSTTVKVRCFAAAIYDSSGTAAIDWDPYSPLAVYPGSTGTSKSVVLTQGNTPEGTVTVNMPSSLAGKNFILHVSKNIAVGSDTVSVGGGAIFSTQ